MVSDALIVFDHLRHQVTIMVNAFVGSDGDVDAAYERAAELIERARTLLAEPVPRPTCRRARRPSGASTATLFAPT